MASLGLRCIGLSYVDITMERYEEIKSWGNAFTTAKDFEVFEAGHTYLGIIALRDPLRDQVKDVIKYAVSGNIKVRMISSDHKETCITVAKEAGIIKEDDDLSRVAMLASEFSELCGGLQNKAMRGQEAHFAPGDQQAFN